MTTRIAWLVLLAFLSSTSTAHAQSFELLAHIAGAKWSEFDGVDVGLGGRFTWRPVPSLGVEAAFNWYPPEFPAEALAFTADRFEGTVALTAGPRLGRLQPFVRVGAGFLTSTGAPKPFPCLAIFPPPLSCVLATGQTMPALEIGGGVQFATSGSTFLRFDAADRILKYPGPTFGPAGGISEDGFFGHAFKFTVGGGLRF